MWPDLVSNPGPLTYESGALPIELRGPASSILYLLKYADFDCLLSHEDFLEIARVASHNFARLDGYGSFRSYSRSDPGSFRSYSLSGRSIRPASFRPDFRCGSFRPSFGGSFRPTLFYIVFW